MDEAILKIIELRRKLKATMDALPKDDLQGRLIGSTKLNALQEAIDELSKLVEDQDSWVTAVTARKAMDLSSKGYKYSGFILRGAEAGERALVEYGHVRWFLSKDFYEIMHPDSH